MQTETISTQVDINPGRILQTGLAFWSSKVLLTAVNLNLFSLLSDGGKTTAEIKNALGLQDRGLADFLDALVSFNFLHREGNGTPAVYSNTLETNIFLDRKKTSYIGGMLEMANNRLYTAWHNLEESLKTGKSFGESSNDERPTFEALYADEARLKEFISAMAGTQMGNFTTFAKQFDFTGYFTHCDVGGAGGHLSALIAIHNPGIRSATYDLPVIAPVAAETLKAFQVEDRVAVQSGDFFNDALPKADVITMGNILHDWNLEEKKMLIRKAFEALPAGGALVVIENVIDDERRVNSFGLMMSLNMLIETPGGFDYTAKDFTGWAKEAGFKKVEVMHLEGPSSALIAFR